MPIATFNEAMRVLCDELAAKSSHYTPTVRLYQAAGLAGHELAEVATAAIGAPVVIGDAAPVTLPQLITGVTDDLTWAGDSETHVYDAYLASEEFTGPRDAALAELEALAAGARGVTAFWLAEGHPFYPVFWDFAFRFDVGADAYVLIGSASD